MNLLELMTDLCFLKNYCLVPEVYVTSPVTQEDLFVNKIFTISENISNPFPLNHAALKVDKISEYDCFVLTISLGKNIPGRFSKVNVGGRYSHYLQSKR